METQLHLQGSGAWRFWALGGATAVVVLACVLVLTSDAPPTTLWVVSTVALVALPLNAAAACVVRAAGSEGRRRRAWVLFALTCTSAAVSNLSLGITGSDVDAGVSLSTVLLLVTLVFAACGLVSFPSNRRRGTDLVRMGLDGVVIGGILIGVASERAWPTIAAQAPTDVVLSLAPPLIDICLATVATLLFIRAAPGERLTIATLALGLACYAASDLLYVVTLVDTRQFQLGSPTDLGWIAGWALIGWGMRSPRAFAPPGPGERREASPVLGTAVIFAFVVVGGTLSLLNIEAVRDNQVTTGVWCVVVGAVLGRQFFLVLDNEQLRRELEHRVLERTRSLRQVTRRSDLLVDSVGDGIYGVDRFGLVTFVNPAAAAALGYQPLELIGHDAHATFHGPTPTGEAFAFENCYIAEAVRDGQSTNAEEDTYVRADGLEIPVEVTASPLSDDGVTLGAVVVFRDVTQRREVDRLKSEFVSMVSHELRTPLTAIRGSLGLLAGGALGPLTPPANRMVDIALVSSERLTRLINEILDLERMEAGALPMELGTHSSRALVETAVNQAAVLATEAGVELLVLETVGEVRADADRVVQTLLNLLGNAFKFSEAGQEVTVRAARHGNFVEFEVADSGRGIPEDKLETVFNRFQQIDSSDAREKGGSGLGLAISRSIVERLGGRIWAENNPGGGAVFRFTLPVAATPASPEAGAAGPATGAGSATGLSASARVPVEVR